MEGDPFVLEWLQQLSNHLSDLPDYLGKFATEHGPAVYLLLCTIVFCETGLVVMPFLPGDSLLFACGMIAENGKVNVVLLGTALVCAALLGDNLNYWLGRALGPRILRGERVPLLNKKNLERTRVFFARHGGKSVVLARFVPIVRTFAPFTAGVGRMNYRRFVAFSATGAVLWVGTCMAAGWFLGKVPIIEEHFGMAAAAVVLVSLIPILIGFLRTRREHMAEDKAERDVKTRDANRTRDAA
jgi:membrane-associated protein